MFIRHEERGKPGFNMLFFYHFHFKSSCPKDQRLGPFKWFRVSLNLFCVFSVLEHDDTRAFSDRMCSFFFRAGGGWISE